MKSKFMFPTPFFEDNVPESVQKEIIRTVFRGYQDAEKELQQSDYDAPELVYLRPYIRLARINYYLRLLSSRYKECKTTVEFNNSNNYQYTLLRVGNVVITASSIEGPDVLPRTAKFRNLYAGQQSRFDIGDNDALKIVDNVVPPDALLYGIILHSPTRPYEVMPAFVNIGFPDRSCTDFVGKIQLCKKYPEVADEMSIKHEAIADKAEVGLKEKVSNNTIQSRML